MKFTMYKRDFTEMAVPLDLDITVERYSWDALGGPKQATIKATGSEEVIWSLLNHLRSPVEIRTDRGNLVWWGYLSAVTSDAGIGFGADLANMFNRVAVIYSEGNISYTTDWNDDAELAAEYGKKEILLSVSDITGTRALATRDTFLLRKKKIIPVLNFSGSEQGETIQATITCLGWYYTLDWQYYLNLTGKVSYEMDGQGGREIGEDNRPICAQGFQILSATGWPASTIWIKPWKKWKTGYSAPSDNLVVTLCADNAGEPGTALAAAQLAGADIPEQAEWVEFPLDVAVDLDPATTYWIKINRTAAVNENSFFMVGTNVEAGFPGGIFRLWNTDIDEWTTEPGNWQGDLLFKVMGSAETTAQIQTMVASAAQFFEGAIIENVSGLESNPFRDGSTPALYELTKLLEAGTTNFRRLLAEVTEDRYLRVYEEPAPPSNPKNSYGLTKDKVLVTAALTPVDPSSCPVGIWCHLVDVIPPTVDLSLVDDPSVLFIEEAEYDAIEDKYVPIRTRDQDEIFSIGGVTQG